MKSRLLCAQLLVATVLVEASVPFSSKTTQASFQTVAHTTYSDTSDVVTSVLETNDDDDAGIVQETALSADHYAAVGILDLSESTTIHDSVYDGSKILLRNHLHDGSYTDEWWGVKKTTNINHDANKLVLSSVTGISCDGFVIALPDTIVDVLCRNDLSNADECLEMLDDVLMSLADSFVHRLQAVSSTEDDAIQIVIVFQEKEDCNNDIKSSKTKDYIEKYLDRALSKLQKLGRKINDSSMIVCDIEVKMSFDSAVDTAIQLVGLLRPTKSLDGSQMIHDKFELIDDETIIVSKNSDDIHMVDSASFRNIAELAMTTALSIAEDGLFEIENKMDDAILEGDDGNVPTPEFGSSANALLFKVSEAYLNTISEAEFTDSDREWVMNMRIEALKHVAGNGLHRLYRLHLQNLRDHFGRTYEKILEKTSAMDLKEMDEDSNVQDRDQQRRDGAKRAEEGFINAAFFAIPTICQDPQMELGDLYSCTEALRGLLEDMYEATLSRGIEEEEWNDVMDISSEEAGRLYHDNNDVDSAPAETRVGLRELIKIIKNKRANRGPAKWYERLAAKALVIGVNYVQGWIVLQTLRREARRRDLTMPKFPLF